MDGYRDSYVLCLFTSLLDDFDICGLVVDADLEDVDSRWVALQVYRGGSVG